MAEQEGTREDCDNSPLLNGNKSGQDYHGITGDGMLRGPSVISDFGSSQLGSGYSSAVTITNPVGTGPTPENSQLDEPLDHKQMPNENNPYRSSCRPCLLIISVSIVVLLLIGVITVNSMLIINYQNIATHSQYLLLPINSTYKLTTDPNQHSAIKLSFTGDSAVKAKTNIDYILAPDSSSYHSQSVYTRDGICDLPHGHTLINDNNCTIIRHWPSSYDPDSNSYIQCQSNVNKRSFLVWQWFPLNEYDNSDITDFTIECQNPLPRYHLCDSYNDKLHVNGILDYRGAGDSIVVMRFCTQDDLDVINYTAVFNESRLTFNPPYNQYTMNTDKESVTVPLTEDDHAINIVIDSRSNGPVEIKLESKANLSRLLQNEIFACIVGAVVITAIVISCAILFTIIVIIVRLRPRKI